MRKKYFIGNLIVVNLLICNSLLAQIKAKPADRMVDMIGVCAHFARSYGAYTNSSENPLREQTAVKVATDIRIRHLRDGIYGWSGGTEDFDMDGRGVVTRFSDIYQAGINAGIPGGITWIITDNTDDWQRLRDEYLIPLGDKVIVLEGANENMGTSGDEQAYQQLRNWWSNILPSLPNLKIASNTGPTAACEIADAGYIGDFVHYGNAHPYHFWPPFKPWGNLAHCDFNGTCAPPTISLWNAPDNNGGTMGYIEATRKQRIRAEQPMIFTEWGYPSDIVSDTKWGVEEPVAAKYLLRGFLEHFNAGIVYSCYYELLNEELESNKAEANFGLADYNGNLKQNGLALKRFIELLEDNGNTSFATGSLNYNISGGGGFSFTDDKNATTNEIHQTLLQKSDSTYYLILWQEAISTNSGGKALLVPPVSVTINFNQNIKHLRAYLPATTDNSRPIADTVNVGAITIKVPDHPVVIEIVEKAGAIPVSGLIISPDTGTVKIRETLQLNALVTPADASLKRVSWTSSDTLIATVGYNGLAKGISEGVATIRAVTPGENLTATFTLKVHFVHVIEVNISPETDTIEIGETTQLNAVFNPVDASNQKVSWGSGNTAVTIVDENGLVSGLSEGNAIVTVTSENGEKKATCKIIVKKKALGWNIIDDTEPAWTWSGYAYDACGSCYGGSAHSSDKPGDFGQYVFTGTALEAYCETWDGGGEVDIYIDNELKGSFAQNISPYGGAKIFATIDRLTNQPHTVKLVSASTNWTGIDYIRYQSIKTPPNGLLTGQVIMSAASVDLSKNTADWKHFRSKNHKAAGTKKNYIGSVTVIGGNASNYTDGLSSFSWSDGTPIKTGTSNTDGIQMNGIGKGFTFTVKAEADPDTLIVYVGGSNSGGTLIAGLSNGAASDYAHSIETTNGNWDAAYTLIYDAKETGQTLSITWIQSTGSGTIRLQASAIAEIGNGTFIQTLPIIMDTNKFLIYPNPAIGRTFSIHTSKDFSNGKLYITNMLGQIVLSKTIQQNIANIQISELQSGIYLVSIESDGCYYYQKLIVP